MLKKLSVLAACFTALFLANGAKAGEWDRQTTVTFSGAVEIPGVVLPAGTYVFRIADLTGMRNVVQVFNADQNHIYATIVGIPNQADKLSGKTRIGLEERPVGTPQAVHNWYYPGRLDGVEFKYH